MPLTSLTAKQAKPKDKDYKLSDEKGLYLLVRHTGGKCWRFKYRFDGKEKLLALGVFPDISLADARGQRDDARKLLAKGVDPGEVKRAEKAAKREMFSNSFELVAREWYLKQKAHWSESYSSRLLSALERDLFPYIGASPISTISAPILLSALRRIESRGAVETAHRVKQVAGQVFRYAVATGRAERDPSGDLKGALATPKENHFAAITDSKKVGPLLLMLEGYQGSPVVRAALRIAPLVFCRPGELRHMEWDEVDFKTAEWRIPEEKMKLTLPHIVPLSQQALDILTDLEPLTGRGRYVFPSARGAARPMSNNAVLAAMRRMGIDKEEMSGHGFRALARTILDEELGYRIELIEHQLAHAVKDPLGRAYNRTTHLQQRKEMMQGWADFLDELKAKAKNEWILPSNKRHDGTFL